MFVSWANSTFCANAGYMAAKKIISRLYCETVSNKIQQIIDVPLSGFGVIPNTKVLNDISKQNEIWKNSAVAALISYRRCFPRCQLEVAHDHKRKQTSYSDAFRIKSAIKFTKSARINELKIQLLQNFICRWLMNYRFKLFHFNALLCTNWTARTLVRVVVHLKKSSKQTTEPFMNASRHSGQLI